ncbi:MAG: imelysin family protein [Bacteroidota bacterium]
MHIPKRFSLNLLAALSIGLTIIFTASCEDENPDPATFDRAVMLRNIGDNSLLPVHKEFETSVQNLNSLAASFQQTPNQQNLSALQDAWKESKNRWKHCEVFNILAIRDDFLQNKIDKWPTNTAFLDRNLNGTDELTEAFVEGSGSTSKGLPALEYYLFAENALESFTTDALASRRLDYVKAMTENLLVRTTEIVQIWEGDMDDFSTNTENFSKGSLNQLVNGQVAVLEKILTDKLGKPIGKDNGGIAEPDEVEAYKGGISLKLIEENLKGIEASFYGNPAQPGLGDLLDFIDAKQDGQLLSAAIESQLNACLTKIVQIPDPLSQSVLDQQQELEDLFDLVRDLAASFKVDMANNLGILITFNDTDGD